MIGSIVVGIDGSDTAARAAQRAAELANALGAKVHLVSAYKPMSGARVGGEPGPEAAQWTVQRSMHADSVLEQAAVRMRNAGLDVHCHAVNGDPAEALLNVADEENADLILVGNRGMTGARRMLGSVPNKLSHHANCDVMIVATS
ncbi:MAG TPA: universal stress protein [Thermoleophilaceae bacterium]